MLRDDLTFKVVKLLNKDEAVNNVIKLPKQYATSSLSVAKLTYLTRILPLYYPVVFDENITDNIVQIPVAIRDELGCKVDDVVHADIFTVENRNEIDTAIVEIRNFRPRFNGSKTLKQGELEKNIFEYLQDYPLIPGQLLLLPYKDVDYTGNIEIKILQTNEVSEITQPRISPAVFRLTAASKLQFQYAPSSNIHVAGSTLPKAFTLDFTSKGVGGLDSQVSEIIRETFLPRALSAEDAKKYGEKFNSNGILLYGPPGTGKTLIAKTIGSFFSAEKVTIVKGPELKDKFVGGSAANLRAVFANAEKEWAVKGANSDLYVIIFDEIDALFPVRGSHTGSLVDDEMVNQVLTILDGVDSPRNVIIIGTTNRKELLDPALLRHGRLGVLIEIGLPDEKARHEIFLIHAKELITNSLLESSVDLNEWAKKTKNYTPAEIEQLIAKARHFAMAENLDLMSGKDRIVLKDVVKNNHELVEVTQQHMLKAYAEMTPMFGVDTQFQKFKNNNFVSYNAALTHEIAKFNESIEMLKNNKHMNKLQILITGDSGVGKTDLAMFLAQASGAEYIKMITPDLISALPLDKQLRMIDDEFFNAKRADFSVIILDDLDSLLGADAEYHGYNNVLRLKYEALLKDVTKSDKKCLIIATSSSKEFMSRMKLLNLFNETSDLQLVSLKNINSPESMLLLKNLCEPLGYQVVAGSAKSTSEVNITIRQLIYEIEKFCSRKENHGELKLDAFYDVLAKDFVSIENVVAEIVADNARSPSLRNSSRMFMDALEGRGGIAPALSGLVLAK